MFKTFTPFSEFFRSHNCCFSRENKWLQILHVYRWSTSDTHLHGVQRFSWSLHVSPCLKFLLIDRRCVCERLFARAMLWRTIWGLPSFDFWDGLQVTPSPEKDLAELVECNACINEIWIFFSFSFQIAFSEMKNKVRTYVCIDFLRETICVEISESQFLMAWLLSPWSLYWSCLCMGWCM